jgi:serine/threonine protein kinase
MYFQENIVSTECIFNVDQHVYIVLELMAGGSLADRLADQKNRRLSEEICRAVLYQLLLALQYLHTIDIVHRDIKPANILLVSDENNDFRVKLADFGLSKWLSDYTFAVTDCGTANYKAPEVHVNCERKTYTSKVDIWSLGATIFRWSVVVFVCH